MNLKYMFDPQGSSTVMVPKHVEDRLQRWMIKLMGYPYTIQHVPGEKNYLADILSRWPSSGVNLRAVRGVKASKSKRGVKRGRSKARYKTRMSVSRRKNLRRDEFGPARVLELQESFGPYPSLLSIAQAQRQAVAAGDEDTSVLKLIRVEEGEENCEMLVHSETMKLWIPDRDHLRLRLCVIAHGGASGHRGMKPSTLRNGAEK